MKFMAATTKSCWQDWWMCSCIMACVPSKTHTSYKSWKAHYPIFFLNVIEPKRIHNLGHGFDELTRVDRNRYNMSSFQCWKKKISFNFFFFKVKPLLLVVQVAFKLVCVVFIFMLFFLSFDFLFLSLNLSSRLGCNSHMI